MMYFTISLSFFNAILCHNFICYCYNNGLNIFLVFTRTHISVSFIIIVQQQKI